MVLHAEPSLNTPKIYVDIKAALTFIIRIVEFLARRQKS